MLTQAGRPRTAPGKEAARAIAVLIAAYETSPFERIAGREPFGTARPVKHGIPVEKEGKADKYRLQVLISVSREVGNCCRSTAPAPLLLSTEYGFSGNLSSLEEVGGSPRQAGESKSVHWRLIQATCSP